VEKHGEPSQRSKTTLEVKALGPSAAYEIGTFSLKTKTPTSQELTGKYVVVWEKVGGDWKLAADIWNDGSGYEVVTPAGVEAIPGYSASDKERG
jgi:ketosteroid isomerase-like protein